MKSTYSWEQNGFLQIDNLLTVEETTALRLKIDDLLSGSYNTEGLRSDLSGMSDSKNKEYITQLMRPSLLDSDIKKFSIYKKTHNEAKNILGEDVEMDFDMIINKQPRTFAITPWHQDAAYWPELTDKRACSFWVALDDVDESNGCMMYIARSHKMGLTDHEFAHNGGALKTTIDPDANIHYGRLSSGSTIAHHGYTLHGALGNKSIDRQRRAWIINYRPKKMISQMRSLGFDHTGKRENKS